MAEGTYGVLWNGIEFTVDGRQPVSADDFHQIGLHCWSSPPHRAAAAFFLEQAAAKGHDGAAELLGHICFVQGDYVQAVPWLRQSSGSPRAAYYLGCLYQQGALDAGIAQSYDDAADHYRRAVALGEPEAMLALGNLYLERLLPVSRAPMEHALEHFLAAAHKGHPYGQFRAAELYRTLYADPDRALALYEQCLANPARSGHALASLMTLQSETAVREIRWDRNNQAMELRRQAVNPDSPGRTAF
ncbi:sel1 repeat family protein [Streptomyces adustus]|uniref:Sel1 repeat family protein n=1 Tax=Streptomyces adustus TaxID=1609272 RepID=A0A5N8VA56_9ACTN|nr:tetratricopeptide repeat protein [Streptomyces adustus]MPY31532.1 sel1 repeat family protein [Streptomyces adustus]